MLASLCAMTAINRRRALSGTAAITVGVPILAACGGEETTATDPPTSASPDGETPSASEDAGSGGGEALASASDVPVGGCFVVAASKIVVTQPSEGDFRAFSAVCTHQGCVVESSPDGEIPCPCHGSKFSLEDGTPTSGPASNPLATVEITVDGDAITLA